MKIYEDVLNPPDEWQVTSTLTLDDDGRFFYDEYWTSYGGTAGGAANGKWRQSGGAIFLRADHIEGGMYLQWKIGQERRAIERDKSIEIEGWFELPLRQDEPAQISQQTQAEEVIKPSDAVKPDDADKKKKQIPTVANLHFKDGSTQQRRLPNDPLFGLFDQMYYQLVDDDGNVTKVFKQRQNSENADSSVAEYDEIDFTPTKDSDDF